MCLLGGNMDCFYCEEGEKRKSLMIEICKLKYSTVYLNRNQTHKGRLVVKFSLHKTEFFQLTEEERDGFFAEMALASKAVFELYHPAKLNYATYGDTVPHVHMHVVPKYENSPDWGVPFSDEPKTLLSEEEYTEMISCIAKKICQLRNDVCR